MVIEATIKRVIEYISEHSSKVDLEHGLVGMVRLFMLDGYRFKEPADDEAAEDRIITMNDDGSASGRLVDEVDIDISSPYFKYVPAIKDFNLYDCTYLNIWGENKISAVYNGHDIMLKVE